MAATAVISSSARTAIPGTRRRRELPARAVVPAGTLAVSRQENGTVCGNVLGAGDGSTDGSVQVAAGAVRAVGASRHATAAPAQMAPGLLAATTVVLAPAEAARSA